MPADPLNKLVPQLRQTLLRGEGASFTDGKLLERFVSHRDQAALEVLIRRYGPMVWGVCRRILANHHDAEDAFQATFLVLVRKAGSIKPREMVGNWLYGVARQTALKARATAAKRRAREKQVTDMPDPAVTEQQDLRHDLQPLLDQELSRLPARYRAVIVLCDLGAKTRTEAAQQIGVPEGTVASRLVRARAMLAKRLARHGLPVAGGTLAMVLSQQAAPASVPTSVLSSTIKAASLLAAGNAAVISDEVAALTEGVLTAMFLNKLKSMMVVLLLILSGLGSGLLIVAAVAAEQKPQQPAGDAKEKVVLADEGKPNKKIMELMRKRLDAAKTTWNSRADLFVAGKIKVAPQELIDASERLTKSQLDMTDIAADQLRILESQFDRMRLVHRRLEQLFEGGDIGKSEVIEAEFALYDAEIALERFKAKLPKNGVKGEVTKSLFEGIELEK